MILLAPAPGLHHMHPTVAYDLVRLLCLAGVSCNKELRVWGDIMCGIFCYWNGL
jgi:hypothetical protein